MKMTGTPIRVGSAQKSVYSWLRATDGSKLTLL